MSVLLALLANLVGVLEREAGAFLRWARQMALLAARAARSLVVWVGAHAAARLALFAASLSAFEVLTLYVSTHVVTPLASDFIHRCIPAGSKGDGFVWLLWDSGLHGRAIFNSAVVYLANYSAMWFAFDTWLKAQSVALSTYRAALRRAEAVRDASILK